MRAVVRPFTTSDGTYMAEVEFEVHPSELDGVDPMVANAAAQWCAGMARSMWLTTTGDIETMAWAQAHPIPDSPGFLLDGEVGGEDGVAGPPSM